MTARKKVSPQERRKRVRSGGVATMSQALTHADIGDLLQAFSAAIARDQRYVDALPRDSFHPMYDDQMWRDWRAEHVSYIDKLLSSTSTIPSTVLIELTKVATTYDPKVVGGVVLETFADAVTGTCPEELTTAEGFFGGVIKGVRRRAPGRRRAERAKGAMAKWRTANDPLRIAEDPECQYRLREAR